MTDQATPEQLDPAGGARGAVLFRRKQLVKHVKTGGVYRIVHTPDTCRLEARNEPAYAYQAVWIVSSRGGQINLTDKPLWVRGQVEMEDGRFEPLANRDDQPPETPV